MPRQNVLSPIRIVQKIWIDINNNFCLLVQEAHKQFSKSGHWTAGTQKIDRPPTNLYVAEFRRYFSPLATAMKDQLFELKRFMSELQDSNVWPLIQTIGPTIDQQAGKIIVLLRDFSNYTKTTSAIESSQFETFRLNMNTEMDTLHRLLPWPKQQQFRPQLQNAVMPSNPYMLCLNTTRPAGPVSEPKPQEVIGPGAPLIPPEQILNFFERLHIYTDLSQKLQRQMRNIMARVYNHCNNELRFSMKSVIAMKSYFEIRNAFDDMDKFRWDKKLGNKNLVHKFNLVCQQVKFYIEEENLEDLPLDAKLSPEQMNALCNKINVAL